MADCTVALDLRILCLQQIRLRILWAGGAVAAATLKAQGSWRAVRLGSHRSVDRSVRRAGKCAENVLMMLLR